MLQKKIAFKHPKSFSLAQAIEYSFQIDQAESLSQYCNNIIEIKKNILELPCHQVPPSELIELKFMILHWNGEISKTLKDTFHHKLNSADTRKVIEALNSLNINFKKEFIDEVTQTMQKREEEEEVDRYFAKFLANQTEHQTIKEFRNGKYYRELSSLIGPSIDLKMIANRSNRWNFNKWSNIGDFSNYSFSQDYELTYRGTKFRTGDFILCNVNLDGNGAFTSLSKPRNYAYHFGLVAIIKKNGKLFPAVAEMYEKGLRLVPLSEFLSPRFTSHAEVMRFRNCPDKYYHKVNQTIQEMQKEVKGYNFDTEDPDPDYLACTSIATSLLKKINIDPIKTKSIYDDPRISKNMAQFGYVYPKALFLIDFLIDERLQRVGIIDNNQFIRCLGRELFERRFLELFRDRKLNIKKSQVLYHLNLFGVKQIRRNNLLGKLLGMAFGGFNRDNLPKGPDRVLAVIQIYEHILAKANSKTRQKLTYLIKNEGPFIIDNFQKRQEVGKIIDNNSKKLAKWFI